MEGEGERKRNGTEGKGREGRNGTPGKILATGLLPYCNVFGVLGCCLILIIVCLFMFV